MTASPYIAVVGGVGRNIAHNLALLGAKVRLITALGADDGAKRVEASCADLGIDLSDSLYVPDGATSTYLFLADSNGDMALAMNDMAIYEQLTPAFLETKLTTLNAAALVVLDTNLSAESIRYLGEYCTAPFCIKIPRFTMARNKPCASIPLCSANRISSVAIKAFTKSGERSS